MTDLLKMCITQGYVPPGCKLDGTMVWLLVKDGKNPCIGCNADCVHRKFRQHRIKYSGSKNNVKRRKQKNKKNWNASRKERFLVQMQIQLFMLTLMHTAQ